MGRDVLTALLIPDAMVEWTPWALRKGQTLLAHGKFDLILSSAHPVCDHIVGYFLKRRARIPWICFYSDPWSFYAGRKISRLRSLVEKRLEARLLRMADHILVPTEESKAGFLEMFPFLSPHDISLVPAGTDLSEYAVDPPLRKHPDRFKLIYTGTFYDRIREPFAFYEALDQVNDLNVEVVMAGHILPHHRETRAQGRVTYCEYQQRRQCIALQKSADMLLFFGNVSTTQLPSKLFEYFAAARPILSIDPLSNTRASQLIQTSRRGLCVPNEPDAIAAAIRELHTAWKEKRLQEIFDTSPRPELSWETGSQTLIQTIQALLA
jgi:glycosyltransferase involved in cell wall biosynthesis